MNIMFNKITKKKLKFFLDHRPNIFSFLTNKNDRSYSK